MSVAALSPQSRKMREAVKEYCGKTGVNAATLGTVTEKFVGLLAARWEHICDVALAEENEGRVNVGLRISFDMTHKTPVGSLTLSFSQRTRDESTFQVEDPDQGTLPFAEVVRQTATTPPAAPALETPATTPPSESSSQPSPLGPRSRPSRRSRASSTASATASESRPNSSTETSATAGSPATPTAQTAASGTAEQEAIAPPRPPRRRRRPAVQVQPLEPVSTAQDTPF